MSRTRDPQLQVRKNGLDLYQRSTHILKFHGLKDASKGRTRLIKRVERDSRGWHLCNYSKTIIYVYYIKRMQFGFWIFQVQQF